MTTPTNDRREVLAAVRGRLAYYTESPIGNRCLTCGHVKHNDLGNCQIGQCGCGDGTTVAGLAGIIRRDLDAALAAQERERGGAEVAAPFCCSACRAEGWRCPAPCSRACCAEAGITAASSVVCPHDPVCRRLENGWPACGILADPAGALAKHDAEVEERVLRAFAGHDLHGLVPHSEIGNRWYHDGLRGAQDTAREWADYRADRIEAQP